MRAKAQAKPRSKQKSLARILASPTVGIRGALDALLGRGGGVGEEGIEKSREEGVAASDEPHN